MTFFRVDPTAGAVLRHASQDYVLVVVEYADRGSFTRVAMTKMEGEWRSVRGSVPSGPLFYVAVLPEGLLEWLGAQVIPTISSILFTFPSDWMRLNAHLLRHGVLHG
jgi:hypothetical protein